MNTLDNTTCRLVDWSKLPIKPSPEGWTPIVKGFEAFVTAGAKPTLIDREMVAIRPNAEGKYELDVYEPDRKDGDTTTFSIFGNYILDSLK